MTEITTRLKTADRAAAWAGIGMVVLGAFCFSLAVLFVRLVDGMDAMAISFYRSLSAFLFFSLLSLRFREPLHFARYRPALPHLIGLGLAMGLTMTLYTYAIQHTTAANAALLVNSAPIYVALLAPWLLKEARPRYTWISLALAIVGIVLITNPAALRLESASFAGIAAGAASGFTYALPMLIGRHLRSRVSSITQILWGSGIAALMLLPFAVRTGMAAALPNLPYLIPLGVISLGLSYLLYFLGLQRVSTQVVSVAALFEPVSGALIGLVVFHEYLTLPGVAGGLLVLVSIYLISQ